MVLPVEHFDNDKSDPVGFCSLPIHHARPVGRIDAQHKGRIGLDIVVHAECPCYRVDNAGCQ